MFLPDLLEIKLHFHHFTEFVIVFLQFHVIYICRLIFGGCPTCIVIDALIYIYIFLLFVGQQVICTVSGFSFFDKCLMKMVWWLIYSLGNQKDAGLSTARDTNRLQQDGHLDFV